MKHTGTDPIKAFFSGESLVIATKHAKERVLQPMLTQVLGVEAYVVTNLDTDQFGTFCNERRRTLPPLETARQKCFAASQLTGCRLAIASEGSFGAHPVFSFLPVDEEILLLCDQRHGLSFSITHLSTRTNFAGRSISSWEEAQTFAHGAGFPSHGLIARKERDDLTDLRKGITTLSELEAAYQYYRQHYGNLWLETDMRAMYNPTRMEVIGEAAQKLADLLQATCPSCQLPGFAVRTRKPGLPCAGCGRPTRSTLAVVHQCQRCHHQEERCFPQKKETEDPQFCDFCNP